MAIWLFCFKKKNGEIPSPDDLYLEHKLNRSINRIYHCWFLT